MADQSTPSSPPSPVIVALAGWILPGSGYLLIRDFPRAIVIGVTILFLFAFGLLIGGVRELDVPGYNAHGVKIMSSVVLNKHGEPVRRNDVNVSDSATDVGWVMAKHPLDEIRSKPWSIAQIMMGPIDLLCDWWSVSVSQPANPDRPELGPIGARSHSRVQELGILYTAIAGMLNLLAIIDCSHRASHSESE